MVRKALPRKASAPKATASASQPATSPTEEQKANTRKGYDRAHSKKYPACFPCYNRQVKCSNTSEMTGFPCEACVRRGTTADCVAHQSHPSWIPGVSGATHKRKGATQKRKRNADRLETEAEGNAEEGDDQEPKKKRSKKSAVDDEEFTVAGSRMPNASKGRKRVGDTHMSEDLGKDDGTNDQKAMEDVEGNTTADEEVPMPTLFMPHSMPNTREIARRALINKLMQITRTNDRNDDQSESKENQSEAGILPIEEQNKNPAGLEKSEPHPKQSTHASLEPDTPKLFTVEETESSLGDAAKRPEVRLVVDQMHNTSGNRQVPRSMHLLMARIVRSCNEAGVSLPRDEPGHRGQW
ncbi:hypothetical protein CERZMDRAFT_99605 [Cercospora zeae-maydis SCOH1-5]|uniref:Zn(2)-C6 fungal-type domain-containing protein n=1 Tax=Cercospora zeae-maydis SCOH1-5 TaxID=717836 RepID=A0A6A6F9V1_9PEZI|nr:hypothetical protein CERZMDRAFT_99605 [Cercospora zeae-maydis SCOH1-5]